jgi:hypothetical protein
VMLIAATILVLDQLGVEGFLFGAALTVVSAVATAMFVFFLDRGRIMGGAAAVGERRRSPVPVSSVRSVSAGDEPTLSSARER